MQDCSADVQERNGNEAERTASPSSCEEESGIVSVPASKISRFSNSSLGAQRGDGTGYTGHAKHGEYKKISLGKKRGHVRLG